MHTSSDFFESDYFEVCKSPLLLISVLRGVHR
jgi:hypothetical protein